MKIILAEAVSLQKPIDRRINDLVRERNDVSTVIFEKGEEPEKHDETVEQLTVKLEKARQDARTLDSLLKEANLHNTIEWDGREVTINEALTLASDIRSEANSFKGFGARKKSEKQTDRYGLNSTTNIVQTTYDPKEYKAKGEKLMRQAARLSQLIEIKNHSVFIEFDPSDYIEV